MRRTLLSLALLLAAAAPLAAQASDDLPPYEPTLLRVRPYEASLAVADADRSARWYMEMLGFRTVRAPRRADTPPAALLEANGFLLRLRETAPAPPPARAPALAFLVDELDAPLAAMRARGVAVRAVTSEDPETGMRTAVVEDPDGHLVQLYERVPPQL